MATKDDYFRTEKPIGDLMDRLNESTDPTARPELLYRIAAVEQRLADIHLEVFGPDPIEWEGGRDLAESIGFSALLLRLLGDVEQAVDGDGRRWLTSSWLEPYAGPVLDRMATTQDVGARSVLLLDLYEAVVPHVGGQAAETLACLPYRPGFRGWDDDLYLPNSFPKLVRALWRARRGR